MFWLFITVLKRPHMIGYVTIGTNDLPRAVAFYDQLLGLLGASRFMETEQFVAWRGPGEHDPGIGVSKPFDRKAACVGNGSMVALAASGPDQVKALYAKALELGGTDEGPPGRRFGEFYAAYFRYLDGNKLNAFCMVPEGQSTD
jgi:catechol 2,3-dioxygenase-like lactoylglutathione lyase family enzyme